MTDPPRSITLRSLLLGSLASIAVCALVPLNDFILSDTSLCAGFMPLIAVLLLFFLVVAVNAPLRRFFPRHSLHSGEMAVVVLMMLVSCGLPNWGLMRFFIPTPVAPFHVGALDPTFWKSFVAMDLPKWLFPVPDIKNGRTSPIALWFYSRVPNGESIPYRAWLIPLISWGIFAAAMLATLTALARIVLDQWAVNERLPFPLVQVQAALIEAPEPGFSFNRIFRSPLLWIGLGTVMSIHLLSCLNAYFPGHFPTIPTRFDLSGLFSEEPWVYLRPKFKKATLSFIIVGVTFFIRSRAAFSLWASFVIVNLIEMQRGMQQTEFPPAAWGDQHLGACIAFVGGILWIGRHHWIAVLRNAVGLSSTAKYRTAFWIAVTGVAIMFAWLCVVGVHWWAAALVVLFIVMAHLVVARVVAETGLPYYRTAMTVSQVYSNMSPKWFSMRDIWFSAVFSVLGPQTTRDSITTFATTGLGVAREVGVEKHHKKWLGAAMALSVILGFAAAGFTTLYCQYSYPTPGSRDESPVRNNFGADYIPRRDVASAVDQFAQGRFTPKQHNSYLHLGIGFFGTIALEIASLRWASWPFLPVGYVTSYGVFIEDAWFSVLVGWILKVLIVRFGGAKLFQSAKPFFIGIIFGEGLAAGIWLLINALIVLNGGTPQTVRFLL